MQCKENEKISFQHVLKYIEEYLIACILLKINVFY